MRIVLITFLLLFSLDVSAERKRNIKRYVVIPDSFTEIFLFENMPTKTGKIRTLRLRITTSKQDISRIKAQKSRIMNVLKLVFAEEKKESFKRIEKRVELEANIKPIIERISKVKKIERLEFLPLY